MQGERLAATFCGAGNGPFIDKIVSEAWEAAQSCSSLDEACGEIESCIKRTYAEFGQIYQHGYCPEVDLLYGVKMHDGSRLFTATGPIVNEKSDYYACGVGSYMADFLAARIYKDYLSLYQCVILAAYILFQAKEHVDGCGGESQIAVLRNEGGLSGMVEGNRIEAISELLKWADDATGSILLSAANLDLSEQELRERVKTMGDMFNGLRGGKKSEIEQRERSLRLMFGMPDEQKDEFGLPMLPSDSQTSEGQQ
jgi:hypothetical protein